jgi:hypothetical protein
VFTEEGLATLGVPTLDDAQRRYEERVAVAALLADGELPRPVSLLGRIGACGGNVLGWFGAGWTALSVIVFSPTIPLYATMGILPVLFTGLFVLIGLFLMGLGVRGGMLAIGLVRRGLLTWAVVTDVNRVVSTSRDSDGRTSKSVSYDVSFMYRDHEGRLHFGKYNLNNPSPITDEQCELLLYDRVDPSTAAFADTLPGGMRIDSQGNATESTRHSLIGLGPFIVLSAGMGIAVLLATTVFQGFAQFNTAVG